MTTGPMIIFRELDGVCCVWSGALKVFAVIWPGVKIQVVPLVNIPIPKILTKSRGAPTLKRDPTVLARDHCGPNLTTSSRVPDLRSGQRGSLTLIRDHVTHLPRPGNKQIAGATLTQMWLWVKTNGIMLEWVNSPPIFVYFSGDWAVHWG